MVEGLEERSGDFKYRTTNLIANCPQKISGIELYEVNKKSIMDEFDQMVYDQRGLGFVGLILDPRTIYPDHRREIGL